MTDLDKAKAKLIADIQAMRVPSMSPMATPDELRDAGACLAAFAAIADNYIQEVGAELRRCATIHISADAFSGVVARAFEDGTLYEFEAAAEQREIDLEDDESEAA